jgi:hypothetical protein
MKSLLTSAHSRWQLTATLRFSAKRMSPEGLERTLRIGGAMSLGVGDGFGVRESPRDVIGGRGRGTPLL